MTIYHLTQYCFFGFGVYNLAYLFFKHTKLLKNQTQLTAIDKAATITLIICGLIYLIAFIVDWSLIFIHFESENSQLLFQRLKGPYGFGLYVQQATYIIISLLFTLKFVREKSIIRFLLAFILLFNFERFVIIVTSLHRDYLPSSWSMNLYPFIFLDWLIKTIVFCSFTTVVYFIQNRKN